MNGYSLSSSLYPIINISVLNCVRLLTRLIPFVFESEEWRSFFWSKNSIDLEDSLHGESCGNAPLAQILLKKLSVSHLISWYLLYIEGCRFAGIIILSFWQTNSSLRPPRPVTISEICYSDARCSSFEPSQVASLRKTINFNKIVRARDRNGELNSR